MSDVRIHHPERDRTLTVPASLFPGRLAAKGWVLADGPASTPEAPEEPVDPDPAPEPPVDEKADLTAFLEARGVAVDGRWGIKRLRSEAAAFVDEDLD